MNVGWATVPAKNGWHETEVPVSIRLSIGWVEIPLRFVGFRSSTQPTKTVRCCYFSRGIETQSTDFE